MDLTLKSKAWAGNIFHQFESICQDVDDFMSKDTVRFVENHVQSVKRLYSNVVQDILPPSVGIVKPESQSTDGEQATSVNEKQLSENQGSVDNFRNSDPSLPIEVVISVDENITRVSIPVAANPIYDDVIVSGTSDDDHKNSKSIMDEEVLMLITSSSNVFFESKLPMVEDLNCDENGSLSDPSVASARKTYGDDNLTMDSSDSSVCDISYKDKSLDMLSSVQLYEHVCGDVSCDEEGKEMGKRSPTSPKCSNILDLTSVNFIEKSENVFAYNISSPSSTNAAYETKAVDVLPDFLTFESNDNAFQMDEWSGVVGGLSEKRYEDCQSETETDNAFQMDGWSGFVGGLSEKHYEDGQSEIETGNGDEFVVGIGDLNLETVGFFCDVNHDETSVILNDNFVRAASYRRRNFRYYKKLIQDALTSRKRLSKEYEHLAILYGDIDSESSQHFEPISVPSSPNTSVHAVRTESFHETPETEWELV